MDVVYRTSGNCGTGGLGCTSTNGTPRAITGTTNRFTDTSYDDAGNVTADSGRAFLYDGLGMLTRAQIGSRHFRYLYSVDDERIAAIEKLTISGLVKFKTTYTIRGFENQLLGVWQTDPNTNAASWVEDEIHRGPAVLARERPAGGTIHYFLDHRGEAGHVGERCTKTHRQTYPHSTMRSRYDQIRLLSHVPRLQHHPDASRRRAADWSSSATRRHRRDDAHNYGNYRRRQCDAASGCRNIHGSLKRSS
jgi:hypothetical protein